MLDYDIEMLERLKSTQILVRVGMGVDTVNLREATARGIKVANVPDYGVEEVADTTLCMLLNLLRRTNAASLREGFEWNTTRAYGATRIRGLVLGIVGFGKIGKAVALRAKPFGLDVVFYDPNLEDGIEKSFGVRREHALKDLLQSSDIISLNCDLNESNRQIINRDSLSWLKESGAYLINTARGGLVDENSVVECLKDGRLRGLALDVFEIEPYNGQLLEPEYQKYNLILTPHSAFYSDQGMIEMRTKAAMEIKRVLQGELPRNWVNRG